MPLSYLILLWRLSWSLLWHLPLIATRTNPWPILLHVDIWILLRPSLPPLLPISWLHFLVDWPFLSHFILIRRHFPLGLSWLFLCLFSLLWLHLLNWTFLLPFSLLYHYDLLNLTFLRHFPFFCLQFLVLWPQLLSVMGKLNHQFSRAFLSWFMPLL